MRERASGVTAKGPGYRRAMGAAILSISAVILVMAALLALTALLERFAGDRTNAPLTIDR
jgi:hypothetical protein